MRLATFEANGRVSWGAAVNGGIVDLSKKFGAKYPALIDAIRGGEAALAELRAGAQGAADHKLSQLKFLPPVPGAEKIICVGINYPERTAEYKDEREKPKYPNLFVRFPSSLVGHGENILRPKVSEQFDYEGEIVLVIGKAGRNVAREKALSHIFGMTLGNEGSVRDWLRHGKFNVTQGKNFDASGSLGPWMVTADEIDLARPLRLMTRVNGEVRQDDTTASLIFDFPYLLNYISTFMTLDPGDLILTGTPTGAGARFDPPKWLKPGDVVEVEVEGIGTLRNGVVDEGAPGAA